MCTNLPEIPGELLRAEFPAGISEILAGITRIYSSFVFFLIFIHDRMIY